MSGGEAPAALLMEGVPSPNNCIKVNGSAGGLPQFDICGNI